MSVNAEMVGEVPGTLVHESVISLFVIMAALLFHALLRRAIRRAGIKSMDLRRRWLVQLRNATILLMIFGLIIVWAEQIHTLALSMIAIAAAIVIATKELILCLSGSLLKIGARSFSIGDRIQIKEFRGEVIDQTLLATTIIEIGPGLTTHQTTGRAIVLPNCLFLSEPVINESYTDQFVLHVLTVPLKATDDWHAAHRVLTESLKRHCSEFIEAARKHLTKLGVEKGLDVPNVEPRVTILLPEPDRIDLIARFPALTRQRGHLEQKILRTYLELIEGEKLKTATAPVEGSA